MNRLLVGCGWLLAAVVVAWCVPVAAMQEPASKDAAGGPYRRLAPGILQTVDPNRQVEESFSRHPIVELLAVDPKFDWAKQVAFRHDVYCLEFKFKSVRMLWVDIPQPSGKMERKLIWYLAYSATNTGKIMHPVEDSDLPYPTSEQKKVFEVKYEDRPVKFIPDFLFEGRLTLKEDDTPLVYRDHIMPIAVAAVQMREDPQRRFLNTAEMCRDIAVGETVWGVAAWEDIDPRIKRFSIYVQGLTNAYRWKDAPGEYKKGDPIGKGRRLTRKTLKLNFWRPGDEYFLHEEEIRYGVPGEVDYEWVYR